MCQKDQHWYEVCISTMYSIEKSAVQTQGYVLLIYYTWFLGLILMDESTSPILIAWFTTLISLSKPQAKINSPSVYNLATCSFAHRLLNLLWSLQRMATSQDGPCYTAVTKKPWVSAPTVTSMVPLGSTKEPSYSIFLDFTWHSGLSNSVLTSVTNTWPPPFLFNHL